MIASCWSFHLIFLNERHISTSCTQFLNVVILRRVFNPTLIIVQTATFALVLGVIFAQLIISFVVRLTIIHYECSGRLLFFQYGHLSYLFRHKCSSQNKQCAVDFRSSSSLGFSVKLTLQTQTCVNRIRCSLFISRLVVVSPSSAILSAQATSVSLSTARSCEI